MKLHEQIKKAQAEGLAQLVNHFGSQSKLADALGVSRQVVSNWLTRGRISATMAAKAETITNGQFKKQDLRPDVTKWEI
jgi:DNA-binding transcriptional regulator YdaS (Cro superfamily)